MERNPDNADSNSEHTSSSGEARVPLHGSVAPSEGVFEVRPAAQSPRPPLDLLRAQIFADLGHPEPPAHGVEDERRARHEDEDEDDDDEQSEDDGTSVPRHAGSRFRWPRPVIPSPTVEHSAAVSPEPRDGEEIAPSDYDELPVHEAVLPEPEGEPAASSTLLAAEAEVAPAEVPAAEIPERPAYTLPAPEHEPAASSPAVEDTPTPPPSLPPRDYIPRPITRSPGEYASVGRAEPSGSAERPTPLRTWGEQPVSRAEYYYDRRKRAGDFILAVGLSTYLAHRMDKRREKRTERQFKEVRREQTAQAAEQQFLTQQLTQERQRITQLESARAERQTLQPNRFGAAAPQRPELATPRAAQPAAAEMPAMPDSLEHAPQQHVEHSSWHSIVVDERGREVQGAIAYGEAFQRERQKEQAPVMAAMSTAPSQQQPFAGLPGGVNPLLDLPSGQTDASHTLPVGSPAPADPQHRLPDQPHSQIKSTINSPWLWLGIGLLLVAFFTAAFV